MNETYKASIRVPTGLDYAYIEIQAEGTVEGLVGAYRSLQGALKVGVGLETKEWNRVLDKYLKGEGMETDVGERMDEQQKWLIHEIDKANNRINRNDNEN